ncbi:MAG TPA: hypothetical protein VF669_09100 [Tepidisphaeraceae bacterium]|jgi:hypothetical protein
MTNRYLQVLRSYVRWAWLLPALGIALYAAGVSFSPRLRVHLLAFLLWITLLAGWVASMTVAMLKEQMATPRLRTVPGYRSAHLMVGALLMLITVGVLPIIMARPLHAPTLAVIAIAALGSAALAWIAYWQSIFSMILCFGFLSCIGLPRVQEALTQTIAGQRVDVSIAALTAATLIFAIIWLRLALLYEESSEYARAGGGDPTFNAHPTASPAARRGAASEAHWTNALLQAEYRGGRRSIYNAPLWRRVRHWRVVVGNGRASGVTAVMVATFLLALPMISGQTRATHARRSLIVSLVMITMMAVVPVAIITWFGRWRMLGQESLRPMSRRRFLLEMALAAAAELALTFAAFLLFATIPLYVWAPHQISEAFKLLPVMIAVLPLVLAAILWVLRARNAWIWMTGVGMITALSVVPVEITMKLVQGDLSDHDLYKLLALVASLLALAVIGLRTAFWSWERAELG